MIQVLKLSNPSPPFAVPFFFFLANSYAVFHKIRLWMVWKLMSHVI